MGAHRVPTWVPIGYPLEGPKEPVKDKSRSGTEKWVPDRVPIWVPRRGAHLGPRSVADNLGQKSHPHNLSYITIILAKINPKGYNLFTRAFIMGAPKGHPYAPRRGAL